MGDGDISVSAYDTAWVALVKSMDGREGPHFPSSINWIVQNQLYDGSWGDSTFFYAHDRILNTLACVIALASWGIHAEKCEKGTRIYISLGMGKPLSVYQYHFKIYGLKLNYFLVEKICNLT
jgi:hypothetical protein